MPRFEAEKTFTSKIRRDARKTLQEVRKKLNITPIEDPS
jgi:hypothetical protein